MHIDLVFISMMFSRHMLSKTMFVRGVTAFLFITLNCHKAGYCGFSTSVTGVTKSDTDLYTDYDIWSTSVAPGTPIYVEYENTFTQNERLTLDDVKKLLQKNETQLFLESFTDDNQRRVVMNHLYFCPYTPLCNFSFGLHLSLAYISTCASCTCTRDCELNNTCCPDIIDFTGFGAEPELKHTECLDFSLKKSGSPETTFHRVTTCSNTDQAGSRSHDLCTNDLDTTDFDSILPVTDGTKNITYKNKHCAICSRVIEQNLVSWQPKVSCDFQEEQMHRYTTETELISFVLGSETCDLMFLSPSKSVGTTNCTQMIETCNKTGKWSYFDPFVNSACLFYDNLYTMSDGPAVGVPKPTYIRYR